MTSPRLSLTKAHIFGMIGERDRSPKNTEMPEDVTPPDVVYNKNRHLPK